MADHPPEKKGPPSPGTVFAYLLLGGLGLYLFVLFVSMAIETFGQAQRMYPQVVLGAIFLIIVAALFASGKKKDDGGGGGHH
jgi:hypothetical protein